MPVGKTAVPRLGGVPINRILVSPEQSSNALSPIDMTLAGIDTWSRPEQSENALSPIAVTGRPLIFSGILTTVALPVYPVIVMLPPSVTVVNWSFTPSLPENTISPWMRSRLRVTRIYERV